VTWHEHNIALLDTVASRLDAAGVEVVFVGGITTSLYLDDAFAGAARGTDDVDCIVEVTTRLEMSKIEKKLRKAGFANDVSPGAPLCRWLCSSIKVDVMPIAREVFGFSNRWYADGIRNPRTAVLPSKRSVRIFETEYFLASKFDAYLGPAHRFAIQRQPVRKRAGVTQVRVANARSAEGR
jgi:hypothetical protein